MMPNWLRIWANVTVAGTIVLLAIGTVVSSFKVGMADPVWPTEPWRLAFIDWNEPSTGFLIEHTHRLAGYTVGGLMTVLAIGLCWTEPHRGQRWATLLALIGLVGAFGFMQFDLIRQTKALSPGEPLTLIPLVSGLMTAALAAVLVTAITNAYRHEPGWVLRLLGICTLVCVMIQGLFGGLRVHLNATLGATFSVIHASFSQVVFGLVTLIAVLSGNRREPAAQTKSREAEDLDRVSGSIRIWSLIAVTVVYAQIVAGAVLRHTNSPAGPRLHLLLAFISVIAIGITGVYLWRANSHRGWIIGTFTIIALQLGLGIESWLIRFANGFAVSDLRRITASDAATRTIHAVIGYMLFAVAIKMAVCAYQCSQTSNRKTHRELEAVA
jgi:heme A synthase